MISEIYISEINISLNTHFSALGFVNGTLTLEYSKCFLSLEIINMIIHNCWHDRTPSV